MKKKLLLFITVLFYTGMLVMTFAARGLHEAALPHVKTASLEFEIFFDEDGNFSSGIALSKELYHGGELYRVEQEVINGEIRTVARRAEGLELGLENTEYYEVKRGLGFDDYIIISGLEEITDGCEIYVEQEEE